MQIPQDLKTALNQLNFEDDSDAKWAAYFQNKEEVQESCISWLAALVSRKGVRFDHTNPTHTGPHQWPLVDKSLDI